jgi:predicted transposase YbfD/YdcC
MKKTIQPNLVSGNTCSINKNQIFDKPSLKNPDSNAIINSSTNSTLKPPNLLYYLSQVTDYRNLNNFSNNTKYPIGKLLLIAVLSCIGNYCSQIDFARFCSNNIDHLKTSLKLKSLPKLATFNRLSINLDYQSFQEKLQSWLLDCLKFYGVNISGLVVSIDGKYLRGFEVKDELGNPTTNTKEQTMLGVVSAFCHGLKMSLDFKTLSGKKDHEVHKFRELIEHDLIKIVMGDSLHTSSETLTKINSLNKQYIIGLKGNCPGLKTAVEEYAYNTKINDKTIIKTQTSDNTKKINRIVEVHDVSSFIADSIKECKDLKKQIRLENTAIRLKIRTEDKLNEHKINEVKINMKHRLDPSDKSELNKVKIQQIRKYRAVKKKIETITNWQKANIATFIKITKTHKKTKQQSVNTYISNIPITTHSLKEFAQMIRSHWGIENGLHWNKDMVFKEDSHHTTKANSSFVLTTIFSFVISLMGLNNTVHKTHHSLTQIVKAHCNNVTKSLRYLHLDF